MIHTDQLHNTIVLSHPPKRIVSLVPSQTELLHHLGLEKEVVGITKFCVHPKEWLRSKKRVGGTKNADPDKVRALKPDLIIGNKEENDRENIAELETIAPVWMSDIYTLEDALDMISKMGVLTAKEKEASTIVEQVRGGFESLATAKESDKTCLYFMWKDPYLTVGANTFINAMIEACGWQNLQGESRYPEWDFTSDLQPDIVLLSTEPYPFTEEHLEFFKNRFPNAQLQLVDGEFFSWYGSRLMDAPAYFKTVIAQVQ